MNWMTKWLAGRQLLLAGPLLFLVSCVSSPTPSTRESDPTPGVGSHGYALLFDLLGDERNVAKLLIIKSERAELRELIKEIAEQSAKAHKQLEEFGKADSRLNLNALGLPAAEVETRQSISKAHGKQLLTALNKNFELRLLFTQEEALIYAIHLAQVTAHHEVEPARATFLHQLARDFTVLEQRVMAMLLSNYSLPASKKIE